MAGGQKDHGEAEGDLERDLGDCGTSIGTGSDFGDNQLADDHRADVPASDLVLTHLPGTDVHRSYDQNYDRSYGTHASAEGSIAQNEAARFGAHVQSHVQSQPLVPAAESRPPIIPGPE